MKKLGHKKYDIKVLFGFLATFSAMIITNCLLYANTPAQDRQLYIEVFLEGFFDTKRSAMFPAHDIVNEIPGEVFGEGISDIITVSLHEAGDYSTFSWGDLLVYQKQALVNQDGLVIIDLPEDLHGKPMVGEFWLSVNHRNHIEIIFHEKLNFEERGNQHISFINGGFNENNALGNNQAYLGEIMRNDQLIHAWAMYAGDIDGSGAINLIDYETLLENMINGRRGYLPADLNGDGVITIRDRSILMRNLLSVISVVTPSDEY